MSALLGLSLWIVLATVVPGLVTIAVIYGAILVLQPPFLQSYFQNLQGTSDWIITSVAITVMVLTQAFGILLEEFLIHRQRLSADVLPLPGSAAVKKQGETETVHPYEEYERAYIILARLGESDDAQGHLKRALAQFFLTNNTLVSFLAGMLVTVCLLTAEPSSQSALRGIFYLAVLLICFAVSFKVARIRFEVLVKSLWAARTAPKPETPVESS